MANRYVDPAATGANNGTSWTDAWTTIQTAADTAVKGDIVYCRGTEVLAASIDWDTNAGDADQWIQFVGCNAAGTEDGTPYKMDGNNAAVNAMNITVTNHLMFRNFHLYDCTGKGLNSTASYNLFINIKSENHGNDAVGSSSFSELFFKCEFLGSVYGSTGFGGSMVLCKVNNNTNYGILMKQNTTASYFIGCEFSGNGSYGFGGNGLAQTTTMMHSVVDNNGADGIADVLGAACLFFANRITNNTTNGMEAVANNKCYEDWNFFLNNGSNIVNTSGGIVSGGNTVTAGTEGYVNQGGEDYTLTDNATLRRQAITVGCDF